MGRILPGAEETLDNHEIEFDIPAMVVPPPLQNITF